MGPSMTARLMTLAQVAAYLAIPKTAVKRIPFGRVMIDGRWRWDRVAIDAQLDEMTGRLSQPPVAAANDETPSRLVNRRHAARPS